MLASMSGAESVLELGTFTGYSALCFAEGLAKGKSRRGGVEKEVEKVVEVEVEVMLGEETVSVADILPILNNEIIEDLQPVNNDSQDDKPSYSSRRNSENSLKRQKISAKIEEKKIEILRNKSKKMEVESKVENVTLNDNDDNNQQIVKNSDDKKERKRGRGSVVTCEMDPSAAAIALEHFKKSGYEHQVLHTYTYTYTYYILLSVDFVNFKSLDFLDEVHS